MKNLKDHPEFPVILEKINSILREHNLSDRTEIKRIVFEASQPLAINCRRVERRRQVRIPGTNTYRTIVYYETVCN